MTATAIPHPSYGALFLRFLRFGALAWGGPVAQLAMIQKELVEEERWIPIERFHRALAVYQALPGPEAHEMCVYFGMLARGRIGGILAGLGFMLPGFALMLLASWLYVATSGSLTAQGAGAIAALQAAVLALILRAVHRIGIRAVQDRWLLATAVATLAGSLAGVHFAVALVLSGLFYALVRKRRRVVAVACLATMVAFASGVSGATPSGSPTGFVSIPRLLLTGLEGGLLSFGGAYTAVPLLRHDAVVAGGWMTNDQFLDGLALSGILPAPFIIFGTFVGFLGGGWLGALAVTAGIFLPAFGFTLVAHEALEKLTRDERIHDFLAGTTAGVVGLIAATTVQLAPAAIGDLRAAAVFAAALVVLGLVPHRLAVLLVMLGAAAAGWLFL